MIFDRRFSASGNDDDVLDAGVHYLLDAVLDERFVHQWQHLFGLRFGCGKKSRTESCRREDCFSNLRYHSLIRL